MNIIAITSSSYRDDGGDSGDVLHAGKRTDRRCKMRYDERRGAGGVYKRLSSIHRAIWLADPQFT